MKIESFCVLHVLYLKRLQGIRAEVFRWERETYDSAVWVCSLRKKPSLYRLLLLAHGWHLKTWNPVTLLRGWAQRGWGRQGTRVEVWACLASLCAQLCLTLCNPMDCSLPGFPVHGSFQVRILVCVAVSSSRGSSWSRDRSTSPAASELQVDFLHAKPLGACLTGKLIRSDGTDPPPLPPSWPQLDLITVTAASSHPHTPCPLPCWLHLLFSTPSFMLESSFFLEHMLASVFVPSLREVLLPDIQNSHHHCSQIFVPITTFQGAFLWLLATSHVHCTSSKYNWKILHWRVLIKCTHTHGNPSFGRLKMTKTFLFKFVIIQVRELLRDTFALHLAKSCIKMFPLLYLFSKCPLHRTFVFLK